MFSVHIIQFIQKKKKIKKLFFCDFVRSRKKLVNLKRFAPFILRVVFTVFYFVIFFSVSHRYARLDLPKIRQQFTRKLISIEFIFFFFFFQTQYETK